MNVYNHNYNTNNNYNTTKSLGFGTILGLVFIVLKLCHVIDWSWWWVLAPIWIPIILVVLFFVVLFVIIK